MCSLYTFKSNRDSRGNGWYGYIDKDNLLVIGHEAPREGGAVYMGNYEGATDYWLNRIKTEDKVLYDDIEKYFTKHGVCDESDKRADGSYCDSDKKTNSNQAPDMEALKKKYSFDEETKTILFKVKLYMDNGNVHNVLVRGRFQSGVVEKLMPKIPEVLMLQTLDAREFAVRSNKIDAVEFVED